MWYLLGASAIPVEFEESVRQTRDEMLSSVRNEEFVERDTAKYSLRNSFFYNIFRRSWSI
jgi:hypothetical protein